MHFCRFAFAVFGANGALLALCAALFVQETNRRAICATCEANISRAAFRGLLFCYSARSIQRADAMRVHGCHAGFRAFHSGEAEKLSLFRPVDRQMRR